MAHISLLHGFLGSPRDWSETQKHLRHPHRAVDLWQELQTLPSPSFWSWVERFEPLLPPSSWVVGYSMGGRLALHLASRPSSQIQGIVVLGAHAGLTDPNERKLRQELDREWSHKFLTAPWPSLIAAWNAQSVFSGDEVRPQRREENYSRSLLAQALDVWSLGRQEDLRPHLLRASVPLYYVHGEADEKFSAHAQELKKQIPFLRIFSLPGGHGVQFTQGEALAELLNSLADGTLR